MRFFSRFGWGGQDAARKHGDDEHHAKQRGARAKGDIVGRDKIVKEAANDGER